MGNIPSGGSEPATFGLAQAVALAVDLQHVDLMGKPMEQCAGEVLGAEHRGPFFERQVQRDDDGAAFIIHNKLNVRLSGSRLESGPPASHPRRLFA